MIEPRLSRAWAVIVLCAACSGQAPSVASPNASRQPASSRTPGAITKLPDSPSQTRGGIRLRPYVVQDSQLGVEAFRLLIPADWKVDGGVVWRANPTRPASVSMRIYNPSGPEEIGAVPDIPCVWAVTLPSFGFPQGSFYLGNEVRPPVADAIEALRSLILPRYSSQFPGAKVVKQELLPEMAQAVAEANYPELQGRAKLSGGKVRVEYQQQGKPIEMDAYAITGSWTTPIQGVPMTFWGADGIRYSKAEKGKVEEQFKLFQAILYSEKMNIQWLNRYLQVRDMMTQSQMEASNRAVQLSQYLSRVNNQISDTIRRSYEQRQAAVDRATAKFDQYIRGVEEYRNPFEGRSVELPSGYRNVWANPTGEYVLSDDPNFNPNIGGTQQWRPLQRQQ
jgi:hypothetical protein